MTLHWLYTGGICRYSRPMFKGIITALITPFRDGTIDEAAFQAFVDWQVGQGVHGVAPCGTTGESPTLSYEEHCRVIDLCVEAVGGRVPVIAGTGANNTEEAIMFTRHAKQAGADAALIATPYYNKPTPEGIFAHYKAIHDAADIPIILYNIPGRSVIDVTDTAIAHMAQQLKNLVGIKDATGDLARVSTLRQRVDDDFCLLSGEDMTMVGFNAMGGVGCISVTANIAPKACADVQEATLSGDYSEALVLHDRLVPLHDAMFCETSPGPVKTAAALLGKCEPGLRLPLVPPRPESQQRIRETMAALNLPS